MPRSSSPSACCSLGAFRFTNAPGTSRSSPPRWSSFGSGGRRDLRDSIAAAFAAACSSTSVCLWFSAARCRCSRRSASTARWWDRYGSNAKEVLALVGSFIVLVLTAGGVIVRAARELSQPMSTLAEAADRVGHGDLEAAVPHVDGPDEVTRLGESIERMRRTLAKTIAELEAERNGLEAKVTARTAALSHALLELKGAQAALLHGEKMASLGQLVAGVAHEINNPLNAIAGSVESLADRARRDPPRARRVPQRRGSLPEKERDLSKALRDEVDLQATLQDLDGIAQVIKRSTERAVRIVGDLLHFSRASSDRVPTDLHAGLDEALSLLGSHLRHAGVAVEKSMGVLPELLVRADEVNQIFLNLLTNALQAVPGRPRHHLASRPGANRGGGDRSKTTAPESPALRTRIFDPFFTTKPAGQGTGLGLSISAQIAARHGGTLTVDSAEPTEAERASGAPVPSGARFVLRLPISNKAPPAAQASSASG